MLFWQYQHLNKAHHIGILILVVFVALGMYVASQNDHTNKQLDISTPPMTQDTVQIAHDNAITRLTHDLKSNGSFNYQYDTTSHSYTTTNNDIRQLMASRLLASLANEDTALLPLHQKNLAYIFRALYKDHGDEASVELANKSKLGGIAMLLRTLVASPYFEQYSGQAEKLANGMLSLQQRDGSFHARYKVPTYTYDEDYLLTFYSGEGILALLEYYLKTKNDKRLEVALLSQNYYLNAYVTDIQKNYYPAYVPWHTMSLSLCYQITHEQKYADAIFLLNDKLIDEMLDTTPAFAGRFYNAQLPQYGTPHTASDGVYLE